mmetsp:Transcript_128347/g.240122  ORF Transcript_128347/g.240122 Transcript_128347/m.240122 type:complete len:227 (+) Transcript_128347:357-1037(+)
MNPRRSLQHRSRLGREQQQLQPVLRLQPGDRDPAVRLWGRLVRQPARGRSPRTDAALQVGIDLQGDLPSSMSPVLMRAGRALPLTNWWRLFLCRAFCQDHHGRGMKSRTRNQMTLHMSGSYLRQGCNPLLSCESFAWKTLRLQESMRLCGRPWKCRKSECCGTGLLQTLCTTSFPTASTERTAAATAQSSGMGHTSQRHRSTACASAAGRPRAGSCCLQKCSQESR